MLTVSPESTELINILSRHGMAYLIDFPTQVTATSKTCIDNILKNFDKGKITVEGVIIALSDHDGQVMDLPLLSKEINTTILRYRA